MNALVPNSLLRISIAIPRPALIDLALLGLASLALISGGCFYRQAGTFRVLPAKPDYLLRSPDQRDTAFPDVLARFNGYTPGKDSLDLRPLMELRVENAYYEEGAPKRGLNGFLGTEIAHYQVVSNGGMRRLSVKPMAKRPSDQPPVQDIVTKQQLNFRHYRYFFAVVFKQNAQSKGSVLLGASSEKELDRITSQLLTMPDLLCEPHAANCTVFPESCSVSLEMQVTVNGMPKTLSWGSLLVGVAPPSFQTVQVFRRHGGHMIPVEVDPKDASALRLPLLPGDHIAWR